MIDLASMPTPGEPGAASPGPGPVAGSGRLRGAIADILLSLGKSPVQAAALSGPGPGSFSRALSASESSRDPVESGKGASVSPSALAADTGTLPIVDPAPDWNPGWRAYAPAATAVSATPEPSAPAAEAVPTPVPESRELPGGGITGKPGAEPHGKNRSGPVGTPAMAVPPKAAVPGGSPGPGEDSLSTGDQATGPAQPAVPNAGAPEMPATRAGVSDPAGVNARLLRPGGVARSNRDPRAPDSPIESAAPVRAADAALPTVVDAPSPGTVASGAGNARPETRPLAAFAPAMVIPGTTAIVSGVGAAPVSRAANPGASNFPNAAVHARKVAGLSTAAEGATAPISPGSAGRTSASDSRRGAARDGAPPAPVGTSSSDSTGRSVPAPATDGVARAAAEQPGVPTTPTDPIIPNPPIAGQVPASSTPQIRPPAGGTRFAPVWGIVPDAGNVTAGSATAPAVPRDSTGHGVFPAAAAAKADGPSGNQFSATAAPRGPDVPVGIPGAETARVPSTGQDSHAPTGGTPGGSPAAAAPQDSTGDANPSAWKRVTARNPVGAVIAQRSAAVGTAVPDGGEKIASRTDLPGEPRGGMESARNKNTLPVIPNEVTVHQDAIGTTAAIPVSAMATSHPAQTELRVAESATPAAPLPGMDAAAANPHAAVSARHAIDVIAQAADAQASRGQSGTSVSFNLKLEGDTVTVRLEMRQGSIQTQIATNSPDLRAAIASEWSGLANGSSARTYTFSTPEFTSGDGRPADTGAGEGGARRESPLPPDGQGGALPAPSATGNLSETPAAGASPSPGATARHLSALA